MGKMIHVFFLSAIILLSGCASPQPKRDTPSLKKSMDYFCSIESATRSAKGEAWFKVQTIEETAQFPALFSVVSPARLDMEITNLAGAVEATLKIKDNTYSVIWSGKESVKEEGADSWRGIPLHWAIELMLGRFPCPKLKEDSAARFTDDGDNGLIVITRSTTNKETVTEKFHYKLKSWAGKDWPYQLFWERTGNTPLQVRFDFESPDDLAGSPTKWTATSALGVVKFRLKTRKKIN